MTDGNHQSRKLTCAAKSVVEKTSKSETQTKLSFRSLPLLHLAKEATKPHKLSSIAHSPESTIAEASQPPHCSRSSDLLAADSLFLPHPLGFFDFAISIAVIHHLSTRPRRVAAIEEILGCLSPWDGPISQADFMRIGANNRQEKCEEVEDSKRNSSSENSEEKQMYRTGGKALIFVWALEQKGSRRGWDEGGEQDVMVPWVMQNEGKKPPRGKKSRKTEELGEKATADGGKVTNDVVSENGTIPSNMSYHSSSQNILQPEIPPKSSDQVPVQPKTYHRYYHLYARGELETDIAAAGGAVLQSGYERDNWWAVAVRQTSNGTDGPTK